jgi:hypothetical protein
MKLHGTGTRAKSAIATLWSPISADSVRSSECGSFKNSSINPNSPMIDRVEGCTVSPRKSRRKSACFSRTTVLTPARPSKNPSIIPAGPPPAMQHWTCKDSVIGPSIYADDGSRRIPAPWPAGI